MANNEESEYDNIQRDLTVRHVWEPRQINQIDQEPKRTITGPKILVGVVFTIALGALIASQKFSIELPKLPKISIVNDVDDSDGNIPFFKISPENSSDHQDDKEEGR